MPIFEHLLQIGVEFYGWPPVWIAEYEIVFATNRIWVENLELNNYDLDFDTILTVQPHANVGGLRRLFHLDETLGHCCRHALAQQ